MGKILRYCNKKAERLKPSLLFLSAHHHKHVKEHVFVLLHFLAHHIIQVSSGGGVVLFKGVIGCVVLAPELRYVCQHVVDGVFFGLIPDLLPGVFVGAVIADVFQYGFVVFRVNGIQRVGAFVEIEEVVAAWRQDVNELFGFVDALLLSGCLKVSDGVEARDNVFLADLFLVEPGIAVL